MNPYVSSGTRGPTKPPPVAFPAHSPVPTLSSPLGQAPDVQLFPAPLQIRTEQLSDLGGQETRKEVLAQAT